ncbi:hypothetical protein OQA88_12484 [Cercophora sp. LCS_1]
MPLTTQQWERRPLQGDEIRVLEYDPAQTVRTGVLTCRSEILKLADVRQQKTPPYVALSYVWGDATITRPIVCDSASTHVTLNLEQALSTVWKAHPPMRLWADAICIAQDDVTERSHQVALMGDIYRSASCVLVSLGSALEGDNRFWDLLQSYVAKGDFEAPDFEDELDQFMEGEVNNLALGLNDLVRRPWFQRAWTYQEIRLASNADVVCGDRFMSWAGFAGALDAFNRKGAFLFVFNPLRTFLANQSAMFGRSKPARLPRARSTIQHAHPSQLEQTSSRRPLLGLLVDGWLREASDPRDKIYAFTSQYLTLSSYQQLTPDYSLDTRRTFIRFVRIYINNENNLEFLKFAKGIGERLPLVDRRTFTTGGRWVRLPNLLRTPQPPRQDARSMETPVEAEVKLPTWIEEEHFAVRARAIPLRQSIRDYSDRLVLKGCALARVACRDSEALAAFSELPGCALKKALVPTANRAYVPQQFQLSGTFACSGGLPESNMVILLLTTLRHGATGCKCGWVRKLRGLPLTNPRYLKAQCQHPMYPRSRVNNHDWLFILDGFAKPVILRPHIVPGITSETRSKIGFEFVSVCPLIIGDKSEKWGAAQFAYGEVAIY